MRLHLGSRAHQARQRHGDKPLAGAVLKELADDRGRTRWRPTARGMLRARPPSPRGEDGRVTVSGVDSGKLEAPRTQGAPRGYTAFEGARSVTVKAEGLDVDQVAAAKPKLTITAESPCVP